MKYKAIIFDLDGTLVHTIPEYRYKLVGKLLADLGLSASYKDIDRFWFEGDRDTIISDRFGVEPKRFWKLFRVNDNKDIRLQHTRTYNDITAIHRLREKGFTTGIVTGAPTHIAELEIRLIGESYFNSIVCAHEDNGFRIKPDPHGLIECMDRLGVSNNEAVYVGNADEDIQAAKNAKVLDILIDREEHIISGVEPTFRIKSLNEIYRIVK